MTKLPTGRLGRLSRLASLGTRVAASRLTGSGDGSALAAAAASSLGALRGLALKMGQMASYVDGVVPDEHKEAFERTLRSLRAAAPTMSPEAAARVVRAELGADPRDRFAEWSPEPFASASIGQVHAARLLDGREVAVKVQYEGVAKAVASDLANASMLTGLLGPFGARFGVGDQVAEMRARFHEELDYRHEASRQSLFSAIFADDATIRVPFVVPSRSTSRVLTTELAPGLDFEAACARPEAERALWAETLWRFVFGSLLTHGLFNGDPHPGNYLFAPGGVVSFLDFGCTRALGADRVALCVAGHRAALAGDPDGLCDAIAKLLGITSEEQRRRARSFTIACFAPLLAGGPFRFTRAYASALFAEMSEHAVGMALGPRGAVAPMPADMLFLNRLQFGFYSVLARLDVAVDYAAIEARLLTGAAGRARA